jgi:predicted Zn finger-like uncharacterized protein
MYTQCPECTVAFRVTAEVLRQAAGKVRCGGCGIAFNALEHLSEQKPQEPAHAEPEPQPHLPELAPDEPDDIELEADTPPQSISAEQSAALLKTLDQLAGSDIRIEDTGVEWRVLNDDDDSFAYESDEAAEAEVESTNQTNLIGDTGTLKFIIESDESDIPADEIVVEEPAEIIEEMRFDDNTPLPDDFDFGTAPPAAPEPAIEAARPETETGPEPEPEPEDAEVDLALGDPDEWEDLLGDLVEPAAAEVVEEEIEEPDASEVTPSEETRSEPLDMDTQFAIQAEAMGIDLSGLHAAADKEQIDAERESEEPIEDEPEEELQIESGDTSIEEDLIAAAFETEAAARALAELERETSGEQPIGSDDGAGQEEAGLEEDLEAGGEPEEEQLEQEDEPAEEEEEKLEVAAEAEDEQADELEEEEQPEQEDELEIAAQPQAAEIEIELGDELEAVDEVGPEDDIEDIALVFDDKVEEAIDAIAASLEEKPAEHKEPEDEGTSEEHVVPEMSEEEKTINMMIDQALFNVAVEDEDGFASTIVQLQPSEKVESELDDLKKEKKTPLFETIIMEGESVRGEEDPAVDSRRFDDPGVSIPLKQTMNKAIRGGRRSSDPASTGVIVGVVALVLLMILQVLHQSREALATVPAFNQAVSPIYRMIGKPLTPTWNISGWRFEATKGSTDDADQLLTIYSRVGNNSDKALPYPLVHLSLTDRYEDIIGSRVLEPGEYLAENADPRRLVPPGNTFNAVISIESPSEAATGFKLNVCYRLTGGQLRCAIEDFK